MEDNCDGIDRCNLEEVILLLLEKGLLTNATKAVV